MLLVVVVQWVTGDGGHAGRTRKGLRVLSGCTGARCREGVQGGEHARTADVAAEVAAAARVRGAGCSRGRGRVCANGGAPQPQPQADLSAGCIRRPGPSTAAAAAAGGGVGPAPAAVRARLEWQRALTCARHDSSDHDRRSLAAAVPRRVGVPRSWHAYDTYAMPPVLPNASTTQELLT